MFCKQDMNQNIQQNRSTRFLKAIGLYAIGNLGSRLLTFLMVPLYTYFVDSADYGLYDLYLTFVMFFIPVMILQLRDGSFRFMIDNDDDMKRKKVVTFVYKVVITTSIIVVVVGLVLSLLHPIRYMWYAILLLIVMSLYEVVVQMVRGLGKTECFVQAGILSSFGIGVLSVLFLVVFDLGVIGIFLANILARFISLIFIEVKTKMFTRYFVIKPEYDTLKREILRYSLPLLPGMLCWGVITSSDRFFVEHFLGLSINGQYAVAWRFASILQTLATVFFQAWQEMALIHYESKDRDEFFSKVLNLYIYILSFIAIGTTYMIKANYGWLVDEEYYQGVDLVFPITIAMVLFALSNFVDLGYQCAKETKRALPALFVGVVVSLVLNYVMVQMLGVYGITIALIITQLGLLLYRSYDVRCYFKLKLNKMVVFPITMLAISSAMYYVIDNNYILLGVLLVFIIMFIIKAPSEIKNLIKDKISGRT